MADNKLTLEDVLPQDRPISSGKRDKIIGRDELGNTVYETITGQQYTVRPASKEERAAREPLPLKVKDWWEAGADLPSGEQVLDLVKGIPREAYNTVDRLVSGEGTYGDLLDATAMMAAPGASKALDKIDPTTVKMFFGPDSPKADLRALDEAENLTLKGFPEEEIWLRTGWWKGPNGWRFEISDDKADLKASIKRDIEEDPLYKSDVSLPESVRHRAYFEALPAGKIKPEEMSLVAYDDPRQTGYFSAKEKKIDVGGPTSSSRRSTTLHELQHYVQSLSEDLGKGTSDVYIRNQLRKNLEALPADAKDYLRFLNSVDSALKEAEKLKVPDNQKAEIFNNLLSQAEADSTEYAKLLGLDFMEDLDKFFDETKGLHPSTSKDEFENALAQAGFDLYQRDPGEVEARLTEARKDLPAEVRAIRFPGKDLDVPREKWFDQYDLRKLLNSLQIGAENSRGYAEGGSVENDMVDPVSGNPVPPGASPKEVRDDITIKASENEYVLPADVVRFIGLDKIEKMVKQAKEGLAEMDKAGRIGGQTSNSEDLPFSVDELVAVDNAPQEVPGMATGGVVSGTNNMDIDPSTGLPKWLVEMQSKQMSPAVTMQDNPVTRQERTDQSSPGDSPGAIGMAGSVSDWTTKEFKNYAKARNSPEHIVGQIFTSMMPLGKPLTALRERYLERTVPKELEKMIADGVDLQGNPISSQDLADLKASYESITSTPISGVTGLSGAAKSLIDMASGKKTDKARADKYFEAVQKDSFVNRVIDAIAGTGKTSTSKDKTTKSETDKGGSEGAGKTSSGGSSKSSGGKPSRGGDMTRENPTFAKGGLIKKRNKC